MWKQPISHKQLKNATGADKKAYTLLALLLLRARTKDGVVRFKGKYILVKRGQVIFGSRSMAEYTGWSYSTCLRILKRLEDLHQQVKHHPSNDCSLVTILNFDSWIRIGTPIETPAKHQRNTSETPAPHKKSVKNVKIVKNNTRDELEEFIDVFNGLRGTKFKPTDQVRKLYKAWRENFTHAEILTATRNIPLHKWLSGIDYTPTIFLRTNKDWIDQCLNLNPGNPEDNTERPDPSLFDNDGYHKTEGWHISDWKIKRK